MAINQLTTANTFQEWLVTTSNLVAVANNLTDGQNGYPFIANTQLVLQGQNSSLNVRNSGDINYLYSNTANIANISFSSGNITANGLLTTQQINVWGNIVSTNVTNNLWVGGDTVLYGNLVIRGNTTLDAIGFNDLSVSGNANVAQSLVVVGNTSGSNLRLSGNIAVANVTSNLYVGGDTFIYGNLTISGNVTLDTIGFDDLDVRGSANIANMINVGMSANIATDLWVGGTANLVNTNIVNINVSNITANSINTGNLSVAWNATITSMNVTSNLAIGGNTYVFGNTIVVGNVTAGNISTSGNTSLGNTFITGNVRAGNVNVVGVISGPTSITGTANDAIYSTISAAIDQSIAFAIALG